MRYGNLRTIKQLAEEGPLTLGALRGLVNNAEDNGFAPAIVRMGRRVLIDLETFEQLLEERRGVRTARAPAAADHLQPGR